MGVFRLLPLGVGDAFSARHYSSCFALHAADVWLQVDCPHPIRKLLREASAANGFSLDVPQLSAVVLSHLHADHASGLEGLGFYCRFILDRPIPLIASPLVIDDIWSRHLAGSMEWSLQAAGEPPTRRTLDEFFHIIPIRPGQELTVGPYAIESRPTIHNIPTIALRITAEGRTLGYSADTTFDLELIDWLSDADFVVHEASGGFMHTPYAELAMLPETLRRKMRLIHYPDNFDAASSNIDVLRQGEFCEV
jgi:ribonuclease BN (tRNA processing enzyme)